MIIRFACDDGNSPIGSSSSTGVCVSCCASGVGVAVGVDGNFGVTHCCRFSSGSLASLSIFCWFIISIKVSSLWFVFCVFACLYVGLYVVECY